MSHTPRYLLVADDDTDDQLILEMAFREKGFTEEVVFVNNGSELLAHLVSKSTAIPALPQLIILDLNMPKKDGRETLLELKQHNSLKKIPVIILSTTDDNDEIRRCYDMGANSYIVKPSQYATLMQLVDVIHSYWFKTVHIPQ